MKPLQHTFIRPFLIAVCGLIFSQDLDAAALTALTLAIDGGAVKLGASADAIAEPKVENLGDKIIIKISGVTGSSLKVPAGVGVVKRLRVGNHSDGFWIVADLKAPVTALLHSEENSFSLVISPKEKKPEPAKAKMPNATADKTAKSVSEDLQLQSLSPAGTIQVARIVDLSLGTVGEESQLVVSSDAPVSYRHAVTEDGKKISLTFRNASLSWQASDIVGDDPSLRSVKARQISVRGESRVVIDLVLKEKVPFTLNRDQNQMMINLGRTQTIGAKKSKGNLDMAVSVDFERADILGVLRSLADQSGFESNLGEGVLVSADSSPFITYNAVNRPLREVLYGILVPKGLTFKTQNNIMYFGNQADFLIMKIGTAVTTKFYTPRNQTKKVLVQLVGKVFKEAGEEGAQVQDDPTDPEKIMVTGFESDVATTMKYLRRWDVPETGEAAAAEDSSGEEESGGSSKKTKVYSLKYIDGSTSALLSAGINQVIPADAISSQAFVYNFDIGTRKLLVTSKLKYLKIIDRLLEHIDVRVPQVRIEGKIIEVSQNDAKSLGIRWGYAQQNGTQNVGLSFVAPQGGAAIATFADNQALSQLNATVDALVTKDLANVISSPSLTTKDGVAATINGTDTIVVQKATVNTTAAGTTTTLEFTQQSVPITLGVTPKISLEESKVEMLVNFTLSKVVGEAVGGSPAPITSQTIQTTVMVSNGETAVIGGLTTDSWVKGMSGVPILSDIPLLGLLFKGERVRKVKKDVIIFITPTIVED